MPEVHYQMPDSRLTACASRIAQPRTTDRAEVGCPVCLQRLAELDAKGTEPEPEGGTGG